MALKEEVVNTGNKTIEDGKMNFDISVINQLSFSTSNVLLQTKTRKYFPQVI